MSGYKVNGHDNPGKPYKIHRLDLLDCGNNVRVGEAEYMADARKYARLQSRQVPDTLYMVVSGGQVRGFYKNGSAVTILEDK